MVRYRAPKRRPHMTPSQETLACLGRYEDVPVEVGSLGLICGVARCVERELGESGADPKHLLRELLATIRLVEGEADRVNDARRAARHARIAELDPALAARHGWAAS